MEKMTNVKALAYVLENTDLPTEVAEKVAKIKETFENKSGNRKPTARQEANAALKADIKAFVEANEGVSATEVLEAVKDTYPDANLPRVTAQLTALAKAEEIIRYTEKKKAFFKGVEA